MENGRPILIEKGAAYLPEFKDAKMTGKAQGNTY